MAAPHRWERGPRQPALVALCPEQKRRRWHFVCTLGLFCLRYFVRPGNKSLCCRNSGRARSAQWACCLFWLCDFPFGIKDFFDGAEDAFVRG